MKLLLRIMLAGLVVIGLSGCMDTYHQATHNIQGTQQTMHAIKTKNGRSAPPVVVKSGYYVNPNPVSLQKPPSWLTRPISIEAKKIPMDILMGRLLRGSNVTPSYDKSVNPNRLVTMNYSGSVKGALKTLETLTNYHYVLNGEALAWTAFETRTFNISFMPGASDYRVGRSQDGNSSEAESNGATVVSTNMMNDDQYSNLQAELSVWTDLRDTLDDLKSPQGKVFVSESTTSATVEDHPSNVAAMSRYIAALNHTLSKEVAIRVQVLDIKLSKDFNYGIDWNAVAHTLGTTFKLTGALGTATNPLASNIISNNTTSGLSTFEIGEGANTTLINALDQQGKVSIVTKPEVVTMNNQVASIRITQNTGYIESVNSSFTENYVTTSITPGTVTDGFTLYLLPKIQGNRIYMQISSTLSNLLSLEKESTQPTGVTSAGNNNQTYNAIEVPTIAEKSFNQRSVVQSGNTLVIAGYNQVQDKVNNASLFGVQPLGGRGAQTSNVETLVLITPLILQQPAST